MWEKINKFVRSQVVLSAVILCVIFGVPLYALFLIPEAYQLHSYIILVVILSAIIILLMKKLNIFDIADFKFKNIGKGFLLGWLAFLLMIIACISNYSMITEENFIKPNPLTLIVTILAPFGTGLYEEVLCRGLLLKLLLDKMGKTKKGIVNACVISSVIFGVWHFANIPLAGIMATTSQVLYATAMGLFLAAIYMRTKTLIVPMLLHAFINLSAQIWGAFIDVSMWDLASEMSLVENVIQTVIIVIPFTIAGLVLLRKVKPDETESCIV